MIDAFRKDFLRSEADWQTDGQTDGRNSAGIDSALKRFLLLFFFESTRTGGTRGEEVIKNLSRIWRPFFFIGVLHFPRCTTIFHGDTGFQPPLSPPIFPPSRFLYPSPISSLSSFPRPSRPNSDQASLNFPRRPSYLFPPSNVFPKHEYTSRRARHGSEERSRTLTIMEKLIERYLIILLSGNESFRNLTWRHDPLCIIPDRYLVKRYTILDYKLLEAIILI